MRPDSYRQKKLKILLSMNEALHGILHKLCEDSAEREAACRIAAATERLKRNNDKLEAFVAAHSTQNQ